MKSSASHPKLELIHAFRGVAAVMVVLFHAGGMFASMLDRTYLWGLFRYGWAGVDFFFVLSGFLMYYMHVKDFGVAAKFIPFWRKRLFRVYPIYWLVNLAVMLVWWKYPELGTGQQGDPGVVLKSFLLWPQDTPVLNVAWTLSYEIFFYLMFGLAILLPRRVSAAVLGLWLAVSAGAFFGNVFTSNTPTVIKFLFSRYNLEFAAGCLSAYLATRFRAPFRKGAVVAGTLLFVAAMINMRWGVEWDRVIAWGVPSAILVWAAASVDLHDRVKAGAVLRYLGDASYSIYLVHFPLLFTLTRAAIKLGLQHRVPLLYLTHGIAAVTLIAACLTYSLVEKPLLELLKPRRRASRSAVGSQSEIAS